MQRLQLLRHDRELHDVVVDPVIPSAARDLSCGLKGPSLRLARGNPRAG
jgi:hypothetical protein